jgi:NitT/TauT family transport system substrate-binding protein
MVLKSSLILNAKDLEGKKVAVNARKNIVELMLREYMYKNGANPDLVDVVELKFPQMQSALLAKQIDAIAIIEPFVTIAKMHDSIEVLSNYFNNVLPRIEISSYHSDLKWINSNKEVVQKFQNAISTATQFCNNNPEEVKSILIKYAKGKPEVLKKSNLPNFTDRISSDNLQILIEKMCKNGWLTKSMHAKNLIYSSSN